MNYPKRHNGGSEFLIIPVPVGTFNLSDFDIERSVDHGYRGIESERKIGRVSRVGSNVDVHYGCERSSNFYSRTLHVRMLTVLAGVLSAYCRYDLARCYLLKVQTKIRTRDEAWHFSAPAHRCRESIGADSLVVIGAPVGAGQGEGLKVEAEEAHVWKSGYDIGFGNPHA